MQTRILIVLGVCLASGPALAQTSSSSSSGGVQRSEAAYEVSGGYSWTNADVNRSSGSNSLPHGWNAGFIWFVTDEVGVTIDFGGHYGPQFFGAQVGSLDASLHTYMGGAKVKHTLRRIEVSARLLGGVAHASGVPGSELDSTTGFALMFGGGLDIPLGRFGIRAVQVDVLVTESVKEVAPILTAGGYYRW